MQIKHFLLKTFLPLACAVFLYGCAASNPDSGQSNNSSVQDITPGQRSIIQPPNAGAPSGQSDIKEKNI